MILVYVCPSCKAVRIASRRSCVSCLECSTQMLLTDLSFVDWSEMTPEQRSVFGTVWYKREMERKKRWEDKQALMRKNKIKKESGSV